MLDRSQLTAEQRRQLAELAGSGGLYRLRLPSSAAAGAPAVATSFPARCLAAAAADGGLELDLLDADHVAAISLNAPCGGAATDAEAQLPATQALALRLPGEAPRVEAQLVPGQVAPDAASAAGGMQGDPLGAGAAGQRAGAGQAGGQQGGAPGGKKAPPPDERSWLAKNWMIVMPLGFIVSGGGVRQRTVGVACHRCLGCMLDSWRRQRCTRLSPPTHPFPHCPRLPPPQVMNLLGQAADPQRAQQQRPGAVRAVPARR